MYPRHETASYIEVGCTWQRGIRSAQRRLTDSPMACQCPRRQAHALYEPEAMSPASVFAAESSRAQTHASAMALQQEPMSARHIELPGARQSWLPMQAQSERTATPAAEAVITGDAPRPGSRTGRSCFRAPLGAVMSRRETYFTVQSIGSYGAARGRTVRRPAQWPVSGSACVPQH